MIFYDSDCYDSNIYIGAFELYLTRTIICSIMSILPILICAILFLNKSNWV